MRMKDDQVRAAYNIQISTENQFITNYSTSQNAADSTAFAKHLEKIINRGQKYIPENIMADSAYGNEENYTLLEKTDINNYLKYNMFHQEQKKKKTRPPVSSGQFYIQ